MPLDGEVNPMTDPTRVGVSRMAFLATSFGLPENADPEDVAVKAIEFQVKVEGQILDLGRELKEQADGNQRHLAAIAPVFDEMKKLAEALGMKPDLDPLVIVQNATDWITLAKKQLDSARDNTVSLGRLSVITTKAQADPGVRAAIGILSGIRAQTEGKNPRPSTASYDVRISEAEALKLPDVVGNLSELEAVCVLPADPK